MDAAKQNDKEQGRVIVRGRESLDFFKTLDVNVSSVIQTNMDVWIDDVKDPRYEKATELMKLAETKSLDPDNLVENVLMKAGVRIPLTIFSAAMKPQTGMMQIYKADLNQHKKQQPSDEFVQI